MLAVVGLSLMIAGAWMLVPRGDDEGGSFTATVNLSLPTVVIDAGHGGHDNGAIRNGLREKDLTLDTALRLEKKLRKRGFPVVMTRREDVFIELTDRAEIANRIPRALFVSIHFNDNVTASGEGVETYYSSGKTLPGDAGWTLAGLFKRKPEPSPEDNGLGLAHAVQAAAVGALGVTDRGVKPARYVVIRQTRCAAVLVEGGFLNNPTEAKAIGQPAYREKFAGAIADGIEDYQRERIAAAQRPKVAQTR